MNGEVNGKGEEKKKKRVLEPAGVVPPVTETSE